MPPVATSTSTALTVSGLGASTTYFYRVLASNSVGDSAPSNVASATTPGSLTYSHAPQGSCVGTYGADGYDLLGWTGSGDLASLPRCSLVTDQGTRFQWVSSTNAVQALESPDTTTRLAATIYDPNQIRLHLSFPAAYSGTLHLYVLDWEGAGRRESISVNDGSGMRSRSEERRVGKEGRARGSLNDSTGDSVTITVARIAGRTTGLCGVLSG